MEIKQCLFDKDKELDQLVALQNKVYESRGIKFSRKGFLFWYVNNPFGRVISFNAFDGEKMVSHQSFVPEVMLVEGRQVRCLRSMSVVTLPEYRGKGIFSLLTNKAVEEARRQGYEFIYAITNGNSYPAFIKHCGFSSITRLEVKVGLGNHIEEDGDKTYKRYWTEESLRWRLSRRKYLSVGSSILGKHGRVTTYMGVCDPELVGQMNLERGGRCGVRLYVGLGARLPWSYFNVPKFVKHSPFHLIFKDLTGGQLPPMTKDNVFYQLLDYDVA